MEDPSLLVIGHVAALYVPAVDCPDSHMTLVLCVYADEAILLAADSRVTRFEHGLPLLESDHAQKIHPVGRHGLGLAGFWGMGWDASRRLRQHFSPDPSAGASDTATAVGAFLQREYRQQFNDADPRYWPAASLLLAGYEADSMTQQVVCLHSRASFMPADFSPTLIGTPNACTGADLLRALLLPRAFDKRPSVREAIAFAATTIRAVGEIDLSVGGPLRMALVTPAAYIDISSNAAEHEATAREMASRLRAVLRQAA